MSHVWRAFAKVNLELRILGKRPDSYHEIRTVMQTIGLYDEIRVSGAEEFAFETSGQVPEDESNLVVRAVRAFERETSLGVRLRLNLTKRVPVGAGLGGGSADAAVTVLGLAKHYGVRIRGERLGRIFRQLGADVPFFALGGRALGIGRGDELFPLPDGEALSLVLAHPECQIRSSEAYSWLTELPESIRIMSFCARFVPAHGEGEPTSEARFNDFEAPVFRRFPELAVIKGELSASGARLAALTGSGSTVFGVFPDEGRAKRAAAKFGGRLRVTRVRSLGRAEYFRSMFGPTRDWGVAKR